MRADLRTLAEAASADPKKALLDHLGDMSWFPVFHNLVLVATYVAPDRTKGGIIRPDAALAEDRFQGKAGLVIAKGPLAFKDDGHVNFGGCDVEVGDWVVYRPSDALELFVRDAKRESNGVPCRLIEDALIKGKISDPAFIF